LRRTALFATLIVLVVVSESSASAQVPLKKNVLILSEVGVSHPLTSVVTQQMIAGVQETPGRHVEFYPESLDLLTLPGSPSPLELRDWLARKYGGHRSDVVVAVGPEAIQFLTNYARTTFAGVPIVICGSSADQAGHPTLDSRFTGTWVKLEPEKTVEVALHLFPNTSHVFVVGGSSVLDKTVMSSTKEALDLFHARLDVTYLMEIEMDRLLQRLRNLPEHSIVLYVSFFEDVTGSRFLNANKALPMVAAATRAPVFGMSDTYIGHGIVGGDVMVFQEQGRASARIVSEILDGKKAEDVPIETLPSRYMFDWNELRRWHIAESALPAESIILFRQPSLWDRTKWMWAIAALVILALSALAAYLQYSRKQLRLAKESQKQLSGMLINAEEQERRRLASELHDDFSQRLAVLSLELENVAEEVHDFSLPEVQQKLHELINATSELGADLHTLSHRLHSSTLESLGLVPAVTALCEEWNTQQGIRIDFQPDGVPPSIPPDAALCAFRIVQEGLRNLRKHSGVKDAQVNLWIAGDKLGILVRDKGRGFDLKVLYQTEGLGIRSMTERAHLLGGEFHVESAPEKGTTLEAWIPLESQVEKEL